MRCSCDSVIQNNRTTGKVTIRATHAKRHVAEIIDLKAVVYRWRLKAGSADEIVMAYVSGSCWLD